MRGQLSLESLLLFLIFLSLLGVSLAASSRIGSAAQARLSYEKAASDFRLLSEKTDSACALGNGNVRQLELSGPPAAISAEAGELTFSAGGFSAQHSCPCNISVLRGEPAASFSIENKGGQLEIS